VLSFVIRLSTPLSVWQIAHVCKLSYRKKDALLKDISQILGAVEKRQVELETEYDRLKLQWHIGMSELRNKESETIILENLIKKRDEQIKEFKAQLAGDEHESEGE